MSAELEMRGLTRRSWKRNPNGYADSSEQIVGSLAYSIQDEDVCLVGVGHVCINGTWFVRLPAGEQKRLAALWKERAPKD